MEQRWDRAVTASNMLCLRLSRVSSFAFSIHNTIELMRTDHNNRSLNDRLAKIGQRGKKIVYEVLVFLLFFILERQRLTRFRSLRTQSVPIITSRFLPSPSNAIINILSVYSFCKSREKSFRDEKSIPYRKIYQTVVTVTYVGHGFASQSKQMDEIATTALESPHCARLCLG